MASKKGAKKAKTIPRGTAVTWHYRSAIGHGTVAGIKKRGKTSATTEYRIREHDHHAGEKSIVNHWGRALRRTGKRK